MSTAVAKKTVPRHISETNRKSVMARWESVKQDREEWLRPFYELPIDEAMAYLENLRRVCSSAGEIMNQRISLDTRNMLCAGGCGKDLSGLQANGLPPWQAKQDFHDRTHPEIFHSIYFCSAYCQELYKRRQQAPCKCAHARSEHGFGAISPCARCDCKKYQLKDRDAVKVSGVIT